MNVTNTSIGVVRRLLPRTVCILQQFGKPTKLPAYLSSTSENSRNKFPSRNYSASTDETPALTEFVDEFEVDETSNMYGDLDFAAVTGNDEVKIRALKLLLVKLDIMAKRGVDLPKKIRLDHWQEIINMPSLSQRIKFIKFLRLTEEQKEAHKLAKMNNQLLYQQFLERKKMKPKVVFTTSSPPEYGLGRTTIFHRLRDSTIDNLYNYKLLQSYMYGPDIIFDCDYDRFMTRREIGSAGNQIGNAWRLNRENLNPFNIIYCNLSRGSKIYAKLKQVYPNLGVDPAYPFNTTPQNFMELYPKDKLVYLTPHAVNTIEHYDPNKVYIIGAMVDIVMPEPLSLAKAKKYGIEARRFPLEKYVNWRTGGKHLQMDHCLRIMLDLKAGHDWRTILLKNLPPTKLANDQPDVEQDEDISHSARQIKRMYRKNKVHELLVETE